MKLLQAGFRSSFVCLWGEFYYFYLKSKLYLWPFFYAFCHSWEHQLHQKSLTPREHLHNPVSKTNKTSCLLEKSKLIFLLCLVCSALEHFLHQLLPILELGTAREARSAPRNHLIHQLRGNSHHFGKGEEGELPFRVPVCHPGEVVLMKKSKTKVAEPAVIFRALFSCLPELIPIGRAAPKGWCSWKSCWQLTWRGFTASLAQGWGQNLSMPLCTEVRTWEKQFPRCTKASGLCQAFFLL